VLCKSRKSDYIDLKTYWLIALLDIMSKALESIMIKRLSDIAEIHHMLLNAQMRARCKWFVILTLDLLVDQVHIMWDCEIKYMIFMLSLDIVKAFDRVLHIRLLHTLKMKRTSSYIVEWARSFLKNRETSLIFDEQTSTMREINADISQEFFISSIFFLFFNVSLIEKCEALKIKIEVLNFIDNINILVYDRFIEEICKTLSKTHDVSDVNLSHKPLKELRKIDRLTFSTFIQLKIEHDYFKSYLHQLSEDNSNKCYGICNARQTLEHLLLNCRHYRAEQIKLKEKAQLKNTDTILTLFITKIERIATLEYLKNTRIATRKWLLETEE